jgi:hypothetical protein
LGHPPVHYNTLLRVIKIQGWLAPRGRTDVRKCYEVENVNDLWVADFMHGPAVRTGNGRTAKAILCAIIDDHSRLIVGHGFSAAETVSSLTVVLKEAFLTYGIPRRLYVDYVKLHIIHVMLRSTLCEDGAGTYLILNNFFMLRDISTQHNQSAWSQSRISGFAFQEGTVEGMAAWTKEASHLSMASVFMRRSICAY